MIAFILLFLMPLHFAQAEYRAFLLKITPPGGEPLIVKSTLDPFQYVGYYPVPQGASVTYIDTWRCWERTNSQPICKSPRELKSEQDVSGSTTNGGASPTGVASSAPDRKPASTP